ncbi:MAG: nucleotidyltransferase family protein [bacterium]|nr:nucleotidyltransferase family protein [bacterium]
MTARRMEELFVSGVILAAGRSARLGGDRPKQLLVVDGEVLVRRVALAALGSRLAEVLVVVGHEAPAVLRALAGLNLLVVENPEYARGQSSSVAVGLGNVHSRARAAMFIPADQPFLSTRLIDRLIAAYGAAGRRIAVPACAGRRGAPVLFDRSLFHELAALRGDTGGRAVLPGHTDSIVEVPVDDPLEITDVDTEDDYRRMVAQAAGRRRAPDPGKNKFFADSTERFSGFVRLNKIEGTD